MQKLMEGGRGLQGVGPGRLFAHPPVAVWGHIVSSCRPGRKHLEELLQGQMPRAQHDVTECDTVTP